MHALSFPTRLATVPAASRVAREIIEHIVANRPLHANALACPGFTLLGQELVERTWAPAIAAFSKLGRMRFEEMRDITARVRSARDADPVVTQCGALVPGDAVFVVHLTLPREPNPIPMCLGVVVDASYPDYPRARRIFDALAAAT